MSLAKVCACLVVLLILAVQPCRSVCELGPALDRCNVLYDLLEDHVTSTKEILRALDEIFFPIAGHEPVIFRITYNITLSNETDEIYYVYGVGWGSSGLFSTVDPEILIALQSMILNLIFYEEKMFVQEPIEISLPIKTGNTPVFGSELQHALERLTSRLKNIAKYQGKPDRWTDGDKGYVWNSTRVGMDWVVIITVICSLLFAQILTIFVTNYLMKLSSKEGPPKVFMWSTGDSLSLINVLAIFIEVYIFVYTYPDLAPKILIYIFVLASTTVFGVFGMYIGPKLSPVPKYAIGTPFSCFMCLNGCMCVWLWLCSGKIKQRFAYCALFCNYAMFANLVAATAIPTLLFIISFPLETISAISVMSVIFAVYFALVIASRSPYLFVDKKTQKVDMQKLKKYGRYPCLFCSFFILSIIVICLLVLYIGLIANGVGTNSVLNIVVSIFPALVTATIMLWVKNKFFKKPKEDRTEQTTGDAAAPQTEDREMLLDNSDQTAVEIELETVGSSET